MICVARRWLRPKTPRYMKEVGMYMWCEMPMIATGEG